MQRNYAPLNIIQFILAIAKLVLYFITPMIAFSIPVLGELFGLKGLDVYRWGNILGLLPMFLYFIMLVFSLGPIQKLSVFPAVICLVVEIIIVADAANLLPMETVRLLMMQFAPDYASAVDTTVQTAARLLLKPGILFIINMILTILYGMFQFIPISEYLFGIQSVGSGASAPSTGGRRSGRSARL